MRHFEKRKSGFQNISSTIRVYISLNPLDYTISLFFLDSNSCNSSTFLKRVMVYVTIMLMNDNFVILLFFCLSLSVLIRFVYIAFSCSVLDVCSQKRDKIMFLDYLPEIVVNFPN